jgi:hypothetical protein
MEKELSRESAVELVRGQLQITQEFQWIAQFRIIDCYVDAIWSGIPVEIRQFVESDAESIHLLQHTPTIVCCFQCSSDFILTRSMNLCRWL